MLNVYDTPRITPHCDTGDLHDSHRDSFFNIHTYAPFKEAVEGRVVVELACGVQGGLGKLVIEAGAKSYVGVDRTTGDSEKHMWLNEGQLDFFLVAIQKEREPWRVNYSFEDHPVIIQVDSEFVKQPNVDYHFGIDVLSFLQNLDSDSVVTVSTGFFHDFLLFPDWTITSKL